MSQAAILESLNSLGEKIRKVIRINKDLANENFNLRNQLDIAQERIRELEFELSLFKDNELE